MIKALRLKFLEEAVWWIMIWLPLVWPVHEMAFPTWSVLSKFPWLQVWLLNMHMTF